jgi:hypothetical protein
MTTNAWKHGVRADPTVDSSSSGQPCQSYRGQTDEPTRTVAIIN